ncbi:MAG: hypothetical protein IJQ82_08515, partial [Selenomonadaceae bacterium]|nr:hypothetical protein [Selenomonadaceae bacterium]
MDGYFEFLNDFELVEISTPPESQPEGSFKTDTDYDTSRGTEYDDYIENYRDNIKIEALGGDDTVENVGSYVYIDGGAGDDYIRNDGENVSIDGGNGDDNIDNNGNNVY